MADGCGAAGGGSGNVPEYFYVPDGRLYTVPDDEPDPGCAGCPDEVGALCRCRGACLRPVNAESRGAKEYGCRIAAQGEGRR